MVERNSSKMATFFYRQKHSRRRLAALNFLSNISLDGSFQDSKCETSCKVTLLCESLPKSYDHNKAAIQVNQGSECKNDVQKEGSYKFVCFEEDEGKIKIAPEDFKRRSSTKVRERSATLDTALKGQTFSVSSSGTIGHSLIIPAMGVPTHTEKVSVDHFESSASGYLFPSSSHCRRISSNTSEGSHSPTGSGAKEKEVRFLTSSAYDWSSQSSQQMIDQRLVLVTCHCSPVVLFSTLPYSRISKLSRSDFRSESGRRRHASSGTRPVSSTDYPDLYQLLGLAKPGDGQVVSYCQMLIPSGGINVSREHVNPRRVHYADGSHYEADFPLSKVSTSMFRCLPHDSVPYRSGLARPASPLQVVAENIDGDEVIASYSNFGQFTYHPSLLDDPELIAGKHSTRIALLTFSSYMTSVIDYVKPSDLKKELNDKFREKFPHIHLTLSKIRSLKREMRKVANQESGLLGTDLLTVAQSYVYFEKLVLRGLVHKGNRKLCAGASLLLSAKMNDVKGETLKTLIEEIQNNFRISRRELFASEFAVLVALEFSLHSPIWEIFSHYQRLLYDS